MKNKFYDRYQFGFLWDKTHRYHGCIYFSSVECGNWTFLLQKLCKCYCIVKYINQSGSSMQIRGHATRFGKWAVTSGVFFLLTFFGETATWVYVLRCFSCCFVPPTIFSFYSSHSSKLIFHPVLVHCRSPHEFFPQYSSERAIRSLL